VPILAKGNLRIDHCDEGRGPTVVLIHSSVSGNCQWRPLAGALADCYRVLRPTCSATATPRPAGLAVPPLYAQAS
jgi:hypothetical protein